MYNFIQNYYYSNNNKIKKNNNDITIEEIISQDFLDKLPKDLYDLLENIQNKKLDFNIDIENLALPGANGNLIYMIGVLYIFEKLDVLKNIKNYACTSAGCLIGLFLVLNTKIDKLFKMFYDNKIIKLMYQDKNYLYDFFNILTHGGFADNFIVKQNLKSYIDDCLDDKTKIKDDYTFLDLYNLTGKTFNIIVSNITLKKPEIFNHINSPNQSVIDSIIISCSYPIIFRPVKLNDNYYLDGGLFNNYPITVFDKEMYNGKLYHGNQDKEYNFNKSIMIMCNSMEDDYLKYNGFFDYFSNLLLVPYQYINYKYLSDDYKNKIIKINLQDLSNFVFYYSNNQSIKEKKKNLILDSIKCTLEYILKNYKII